MASSPTRLDVKSTDDIQHGCKKAGYTSKERAWEIAEWMMERGFVDPGCHMAHYLCDECGYWHIGNRQIVHPIIVAEYLAGMRG